MFPQIRYKTLPPNLSLAWLHFSGVSSEVLRLFSTSTSWLGLPCLEYLEDWNMDPYWGPENRRHPQIGQQIEVDLDRQEWQVGRHYHQRDWCIWRQVLRSRSLWSGRMRRTQRKPQTKKRSHWWLERRGWWRGVRGIRPERSTQCTAAEIDVMPIYRKKKFRQVLWKTRKYYLTAEACPLTLYRNK